ncbi:MAG: outer membrane protein assembly factor BamA [Gammaproteobacteria bacterium]|nr:outer membrane protein assembly factor BamA [Gammaproteobacteria bacterium]
MDKIKKITLVGVISLALGYSTVASSFIVKKIRVQGLQRIPSSTVITYLPVKEGQDLDPAKTSDIIRALYRTGFFSDVNVGRQGDDLVIQVVERPVIGAIRISGNKEIKTPDLTNALKKAGIAEGLPFDNSVLDAMKRAMEQQYNSQGRYAAAVNTTVTNESQNRVSVKLEIVEGKVSKIKEIHITGNKAFTESKLLRQFQSGKTHPWSFFTSSDQYVKEKLDADLDVLKAFYMDRGYLKIKIVSSNTRMSPDKKKVFVDVVIEEGPVFKVRGVELTGEFFGQKALLQQLVTVKPGKIFSRKEVVDVREHLDKFLSNEGYALAQVDLIPDVDEANNTVFITYNINPGKRVYVRRINFAGNVKTTDEVLRRELRQMEGAMYSTYNVEESKRRLSNLGYLQNIQIRAIPIPENPNSVDLEYQVTESSSATANFQVGFSDSYGLLYGANLNQTNFLGTGRRVSANFQANDASTSISLTYYNPYYTMSGIGRGFTIYTQFADPGKVGITPFRMDTYGAAVNYDVPIAEFSRLNFAFGYDSIRLYINSGASYEVKRFIAEHGDNFDQFKATLGWSRSTYDSAVFPVCGWKQFFGVELGLPFARNSLDYYKISYSTAYYHPIVGHFLFHARAQLGYGNGFGNTGELPFFKNYYAGGIDSVRGFDDNTLGPRDSNIQPIGGNVLTTGSIALIYPNPFPDQLRTSLFVDAGNVFHNDMDLGGIRTAAGLQFEWISPMGPIHFSFAKPLNKGRFDEPKLFQFSLGASF